MNDIRIKHLDDIAAYEGPHAIEGIRFRPVRQALGVSAWGMNLLEIAPGCDGHPEHDHRGDGHEEVYLVLRGRAVLRIDGEEHALSQGQLAFVPGNKRRQLVTRDEAATVLALGGTPGQPYAPSMGG